ncbi:triacylglycerol lipase [uncultured Shewanella sp.]|uniref:esterase/lipase family protein n=1 Tax=uncultured Shewanella sp. TaxID=173975 RepID=UPI0026330FB5|nr:triacylglycerol lipase [uncultured Shewanella sp.]
MKKWMKVISVILLCFTGASYAGNHTTDTKYPIVMVHGLFGFDDIWGLDYFYGIPQALKENGADVYIASVSPSNTTEVRGEQLRTYIQGVIALTGSEKVNIIGHSHGGPTARYVASVSPELVASVTSVGGVNWGSTFADVARGAVPYDSSLEWIIEQAFDSLAIVIAGLSGAGDLPADSLAMVDSLTTEGSIRFNNLYPEGMPTQYCGEGEMLANNGVHYFSWSGADPMTHVLDAGDYALSLISTLFNEKNDGLVSSCSSHLGKVIQDDYKMNHLDEINQFFGLVSWWETNPVNIYRQHVNYLKSLGL